MKFCLHIQIVTELAAVCADFFSGGVGSSIPLVTLCLFLCRPSLFVKIFGLRGGFKISSKLLMGYLSFDLGFFFRDGCLWVVVCCLVGFFETMGSSLAGAAASCCFALISRSSSRTEGRSSGGLTVPSAVLFCFFEIGADGWDFSAAFPKESFLLTSGFCGVRSSFSQARPLNRQANGRLPLYRAFPAQEQRGRRFSRLWIFNITLNRNGIDRSQLEAFHNAVDF